MGGGGGLVHALFYVGTLGGSACSNTCNRGQRGDHALVAQLVTQLCKGTLAKVSVICTRVENNGGKTGHAGFISVPFCTMAFGPLLLFRMGWQFLHE